MAKDREKEREAELKSVMYTNYLLLSLDPTAPPSRRAAPVLLPLLPPWPAQSAKDFDQVWPIFDSAQSREFRRDYKTHTTRSWDFVGLNYHQPSGLLQKAKYGEDVIVGVIGSGIWPKSQSFDDNRYNLVPARWRGAYEARAAFNTTSCNRKIIDVES